MKIILERYKPIKLQYFSMLLILVEQFSSFGSSEIEQNHIEIEQNHIMLDFFFILTFKKHLSQLI